MNSAMTINKTKFLIVAAVVLSAASSAQAAPGCSADPFVAYRSAFNAGGPATDCALAGPTTGVGRAGLSGASCLDDPQYRVRQALWGDGPAHECAASSDRAAAHGPTGPIMRDAQDEERSGFRYSDIFTGD